MTLEQLMAFTVTNDHARQEQVWEALAHSYNKEPYPDPPPAHRGRRAGPPTGVRCSSAPKPMRPPAASILRDLFEDDDGGWLQDRRCSTAWSPRSSRARPKDLPPKAGSGSRWRSTSRTATPTAFAGSTGECRPTHGGGTGDLRSATRRIRPSSKSEYEGADELPDEVDARLGEIETALAGVRKSAGAITIRPRSPVPGSSSASIAMAALRRSRLCPARRTSAPVANSRPRADGETRRRRDVPPPPARRAPSSPSGGRRVGRRRGRRDQAAAGPPGERADRLPHAGAAGRGGEQPAGRLDGATAQALPRHLPAQLRRRGCLEVSVRHVFFPVQAPDLKDSPSAKAVAERQEAWKADCPRTRTRCGIGSPASTTTRRMALLAHCVSFGVNALYEKGDRYGGPASRRTAFKRRIAQADRLRARVGLDMVEAGWRPRSTTISAASPKPRILEAVREAKGEQAAQLIDHLKKADMAKEAERLLEGTGWLPEPLTSADSGLVRRADRASRRSRHSSPATVTNRPTMARTHHLARGRRRVTRLAGRSEPGCRAGLSLSGSFPRVPRRHVPRERGRGRPGRVEPAGLRESASPVRSVPALRTVSPM